MDRVRWIIVGIVLGHRCSDCGSLARGDQSRRHPHSARPDVADEAGAVPAAALLRVPVTGIYPGGNPAGLNANMQNPLANDPDAPSAA